MQAAIIILAAVIANGFGRRFAGGLLQQWLGPIGGTQVGRLVQAAIAGASVAVLAWHAGQALLPIWWVPLAAAAAVFVGATWGFPRYALRWPFLNLRASHMVPEGLGDTIGLSLNGIAACAPLALLAWWLGLDWWWLVAAGVVRGPAYWLAAAALPPWRWMGFRWFAPDQGRDIPMPTALAEFYAGAALGLGLVLALM
jgi:hypothetical protein